MAGEGKEEDDRPFKCNQCKENLRRHPRSSWIPLTIPLTSLNSDPLGPLLDGLMGGDKNLNRSKFSPLFTPLGGLPRSPSLLGLSPFGLSPNFGLMNTTVEPQYTITSLDSRNGKAAPLSPGAGGTNDSNSCTDVGNGLVVIREALSNCKS
eukprot:sb/3473520/